MARAARMNPDDLAARRPLQMPLVLRLLLRAPLLLRFLIPRSRDSVVGTLAGVAALAILVNALFMQSGPHPAPIFANKPAPLASPTYHSVSTLMPQPKPQDAAADDASGGRTRVNLLSDIQRELAARGFYEGSIDGVYGPRTDGAIRDFEQAAGLRPSAEPNEALLAAIANSKVKATPAPAVRSNDPIAALLAPDKRLVAIQRALADFGYGPIQPTGAMDDQTRSAIQRFERARKRPATGQVSQQLVRDLAAMTGRPLEW